MSISRSQENENVGGNNESKRAFIMNALSILDELINPKEPC
jgi:hypothetical protein